MGAVYEGVCIGAGGVLPALGGIGFLCAMSESGHLAKTVKILGASGGVFPALMWARGMSPFTMTKLALERDLSCLTKPVQRPLTFTRRRLFGSESDRLNNSLLGMLDSTGAGEFCTEICPSWPDTLAIATVTSRGKPIVCTADGLFLHTESACHQLSRQAPNLGAAAQASCAIPEFVTAVRLPQLLPPDGVKEFIETALLLQHFDRRRVEEAVASLDLTLLAEPAGVAEQLAKLRCLPGFAGAEVPTSFHDGAFSVFGGCPAALLIKQYGLDSSRVAAFMPDGFVAFTLRQFYLAVRFIRPALPQLPYAHNEHRFDAGFLSEPKIHFVGPLSFHLSATNKLAMIFAGYTETNRRLIAAGEEVPTDREQHAVMLRLFRIADCAPPAGFNPHRFARHRLKATSRRAS